MHVPKVTAFLCALAAFCGSLAVASPAFASHAEVNFFEAPQQLLNPAARPAAIAQLQSLGVHAVRIQLIWNEVAPSPRSKKQPKLNLTNPANYHWGQYQPLIQEMQTLGWKVLLTVTGYAPCWASQCSTTKYTTKELVTDPNPRDYGQFTQAVGREFGSYVKLYSIWNEPNQTQELEPQYLDGNPKKTLESAVIYRKLFLDGYAGLKASGNFAGTKVLMGETSPLGVTAVDISPPLAFLRGALCLNTHYVKARGCGMLPAAGYAQHPYDQEQGPFWRPPRAYGGADDVTIATLGQLQTALRLAADAHAIPKSTPIYITEFGVQSYPNHYLGVPAATQAEYDAIAEQTAWNDPDVASFSQYLLSDDPDPGEGSFQTGLLYVKGKPKPLYNGYRLPLTVTVSGGSRVSFWGLVRPATAASQVALQYSDNGGAWQQLLTAQTNALGYWSATGLFDKQRVWRVQWTSPSGTVYVGAPIRAYLTGNPKPQT
ncbi:MAG TPA: hypothetical protein VHM72_02485 [Solirubrobacteraceae bacterium]|nr:hypothetical protein [Solirubrobacteraceae bacterium]